MATVYTVAQQKGGAGKTMLAANLAAALATEGRVAVIDIDPQRSLTRWHRLRQQGRRADSLACTEIAGWRLSGELDRARREHDWVVIDTPPQIDTEARLAIRGADLVLIPLQPSPPDLWAAEGTIKLAAAERRPTRLVLTCAPAASRLRSAVEAAIAAAGCETLPALGNRAGYANAFAAGLGVTEAAPKSRAATEFLDLLAAIREITG